MDDNGDDMKKVYGRYCNTTVPDVINIKSNRVTVHFLSDISVSGSGFRLEWSNDGCGGILTKPEGTFSTPNYPRGYPYSTECNWTIQAEPGNRIRITFDDIDLESADCVFDYIHVRTCYYLYYKRIKDKYFFFPSR